MFVRALWRPELLKELPPRWKALSLEPFGKGWLQQEVVMQDSHLNRQVMMVERALVELRPQQRLGQRRR